MDIFCCVATPAALHVTGNACKSNPFRLRNIRQRARTHTHPLFTIALFVLLSFKFSVLNHLYITLLCTWLCARPQPLLQIISNRKLHYDCGYKCHTILYPPQCITIQMKFHSPCIVFMNYGVFCAFFRNGFFSVQSEKSTEIPSALRYQITFLSLTFHVLVIPMQIKPVRRFLTHNVLVIEKLVSFGKVNFSNEFIFK